MNSRKNTSNLITFCEVEFNFQDERGCLKQLFGKGGWNQANIITSYPGSLRGNHYHINNREMFFIIKGSFNLVLQKETTKEIYNIIKDDFFIIEKGVNHSFEFLEETILVSFYDLGVENTSYKIDIHR